MAALATLVVLAISVLTAPDTASAQQAVIPPTILQPVPTRPGPTIPVPAVPVPPNQVAAVQAAIQRAHDEESRALATGELGVMQDTATAPYYEQLVRNLALLTAQGAIGLKLTNLTWGPVTVTGNGAVATANETWITTFDDGTTVQSTFTKIYSLLRQNGAWLIDADQVVPAPAQAGSGGPPLPQPTPVPAGQPGTSRNWSGYVATGGRFTGVTGTWTVPQPLSSGTPFGTSGTWVGIGGLSSHDLIQAGTQEETNGLGQAQFATWIETLPDPPQQVPLAIVPGDSVTVSIVEQGAGTGDWRVSLKNNTTGQSFQTTVLYPSTESSAEWIAEAPSGPGGVLPIDAFGAVAITEASAVRNGQTVNLTQLGARPMTLVNAANQPLAIPSSIGPNGSSFTIVRTVAPATPVSRGGRPIGAAVAGLRRVS
jgi:hypothetical protein